MKVLLLGSCLSSIAFGGWQQIGRGNIVYQGGAFSEENGGWGPEATPRGFVGWRCTGGNCDNKQMRAPNTGENVLGGNVVQGKSDISEEGGRNIMNCGGDRLIYRLRCRGGYCDNTDVWCKQLAVVNGQRIRISSSTWTGWFSEEHGGLKDCPANSWLWGMHCSGGHCDNMRLQCAYLQKWVPNNCAVSAFGGWSSCSKSCGGGSQTRSRSVTRQPESGGQGCPALSESRSCNTQACPVDCTVSAFGAWGNCSKTCGGGEQTRTRKVTRAAANNGKACPALSEKRSCNTGACPVDCVVSAFSEWGNCSKTCGGGEQSRTRKVTRAAANNGKACPALSEKRECNTDGCPVDCVVSAFGEWGQCSEECGGGEQTRTRKVTRAAANNGKACPALSEKQNCNEEVCCEDLTVQNKRLKVKGKAKTKKKSFKGENAEDTACQCLEHCQGQEGMLYWSAALNSDGKKGKCQCYGGKLKKVLDPKGNKKNFCGGTTEENQEAVSKKAN